MRFAEKLCFSKLIALKLAKLQKKNERVKCFNIFLTKFIKLTNCVMYFFPLFLNFINRRFMQFNQWIYRSGLLSPDCPSRSSRRLQLTGSFAKWWVYLCMEFLYIFARCLHCREVCVAHHFAKLRAR